MKEIMRDKRELDMYLNLINAKRGLVSTVVLSFALPLILLITNISNAYGTYGVVMNAGYITMEVIQLVFAILFYIVIRSNNIDIFSILYTSYYALTIGAMLCCSVYDMTASGSELLYIVTCTYFVFVPIFGDKLRMYFSAGQTVIMFALMIITHMGIRMFWDMGIIQIATVFISRYQHRLTVRIEKMTNNLKKKTISSEQDALTGLTNRRGLERRAEAIWPYCAKNKATVGVITLDIDYFKKYNDKFGHPQGDKCLKMIAEVLKNSANGSTDVVTRTGGEEFLIFVQDITNSDLVSLALKIRQNIDAKAIPHAYCAVSKNVTVSIGIASIVPGYEHSFQQLYEEADRALYLAKENGRNCIVYDGNLYGRIRNGMAQVISM